MKSKFIKDLKPNDKFTDELFAVKNIAANKTKDGRDYLDLIVSDKTGEINAKVWEASLETVSNIKPGTIALMTGKAEEFRGKMQLNISFLQKANDKDLDRGDFLKQTTKDIEKLWTTLKKQADRVADADLKRLIKYFIEDEKFTEEFKLMPAGERMHHAYLGGLLEHTVEMLILAETVLKEFPNINQDLLITGILLHDIGKLEEYTIDNAIHRTTLGNLIGHTVMGAISVARAVEALKNFPKELYRKLVHMLLSHHGQLEFGSPVLPMTREAVALHYLDNLSAKVNTADQTITAQADSEQEFSEFNKALETRLYLK